MLKPAAVQRLRDFSHLNRGLIGKRELFLGQSSVLWTTV